MTPEQFNNLTFSKKLPFRVSEALRYVLVNGMEKKTAIYCACITTQQQLILLDEMLIEIESK
jgi:hypothetical protein